LPLPVPRPAAMRRLGHRERLLRGKRLALVFGVGKYNSSVFRDLPGALNDAEAMAKQLLSMGYTLISQDEPGRPVLNADLATMRGALVEKQLLSMGYTLVTGRPVLNADLATMRGALEELNRQLSALDTDCTVVVYFAGHGMQGYLLPADVPTDVKGTWELCLLSGVLAMRSWYCAAVQKPSSW
jgi:hypothetical protein